ncbi:MAG: nucleotidyltransferase domain-containing protein [Candidatus Gastranaerophilales bacterium]|nr:nucleotidyltransferase domain-containing protein [Candidatus Gastranaerophilales bacterium]
MINLEEKYINFVKEIVAKHLQDCEVYIFGSRVKNTAKKYSDIDIALKCKNLTPENLLKIQAEFENSTLPYEVDVIDLNSVSETFKKHIIRDLTKI